MDSRVRTISERQAAANSYLIEAGEDLILIDAGFSPDELNRITAQETARSVTDVVLTHGHYDHAGAGPAWQAAGVRLIAAGQTARYLADDQLNLSHLFGRSLTASAPDILLTDGGTLELGTGIQLTAYHCPGHTEGDMLLLFCMAGEPFALFVGDVLFADSVGRTDFPGGDARVQQRSLRRIVSLFRGWPGDLPVYPGHGPATTVARLQQENPWFVALSE